MSEPSRRLRLAAHWSLIAVATIAAASAAAGAEFASRSSEKIIVLRGVTLIDGTGAAPRPNATVVVEAGRIRRVGGPEVRTPSGATEIDASGKFLIPGLIDMHAHVTLGPVSVEVVDGVPSMRVEYDPAVAPLSLAALLEHGVTTIRDPGGDTARTIAVRDAVARGELPGPRMYVAGSVIDRTPFPGLTATFDTKEELRAEIRRQAEAGVDLIKLYVTLTPELMAVGVDEAHRQGLPAVAHTMMTSWTEAARMGLDGIVHILPGSASLLPEDERAAFGREMAGTQFMFTWFERVDLDSAEIREMLAALLENDVTVDPTLVMWETMMRGDDPTVIESPRLDKVAPSLLENWRSFFTMNIGWSPEDFVRARAAFSKALAFARLLYESGVLLTAGTDANNPWVVPGPSLHRELELLAEAGIPPLEVLSIATRNGARVLGILGKVGTVEPGKTADLLLLRADPVADISATREIEWVMQRGRILER